MTGAEVRALEARWGKTWHLPTLLRGMAKAAPDGLTGRAMEDAAAEIEKLRGELEARQ